MMKTQRTVIVLVLLSLMVVSSAVFSQDRRPPREKWIHVTIKATVKEIDLKTRELVLRGPSGNLLTVEADDRVERLHEIKVGDIISTEYFSYLMAEFRDPTPEEKENPVVILAEGGKAPKGLPPAAEVGAIVRAVVTIEVIDRPDMEVTVQGPGGNYVTIPAEDRELLEKLNVGEVVILTYAEALALSLEKVGVKE